MFISSKIDINLNYAERFSSYRAVNNFLIGSRTNQFMPLFFSFSLHSRRNIFNSPTHLYSGHSLEFMSVFVLNIPYFSRFEIKFERVHKY